MGDTLESEQELCAAVRRYGGGCTASNGLAAGHTLVIDVVKRIERDTKRLPRIGKQHKQLEALKHHVQRSVSALLGNKYVQASYQHDILSQVEHSVNTHPAHRRELEQAAQRLRHEEERLSALTSILENIAEAVRSFEP
jgi:hypothetical protein